MKLKKILIVLIIIFLGVSLFAISIVYKKSHTFDSEAWNLNVDTRYKMVDSLVEQYNLIGQSKEDILKLLGTKEVLSNNTERIEYYISPGKGDPLFFGVYFNSEGFVAMYKVFEH